MAFAFSVHAGALGLYLFSMLSKSALQTPILREVEFMDFKPAPVEVPHAAPAQTAPRSLTDFLKMAMPKLAAPQDSSLRLPSSSAKEISRELAPSPA